METKVQQIGKLIRNTRKSLKKSVREVSEATGIHSGAIIKFEKGKTDMTFSRIMAIFDYLGLPFALLDGAREINVYDWVHISTVADNLIEITDKVKELLFRFGKK